MGLLLSVLVFSVGVIEALSCYQRFRTGYLPLSYQKGLQHSQRICDILTKLETDVSIADSNYAVGGYDSKENGYSKSDGTDSASGTSFQTESNELDRDEIDDNDSVTSEDTVIFSGQNEVEEIEFFKEGSPNKIVYSPPGKMKAEEEAEDVSRVAAGDKELPTAASEAVTFSSYDDTPTTERHNGTENELNINKAGSDFNFEESCIIFAENIHVQNNLSKLRRSASEPFYDKSVVAGRLQLYSNSISMDEGLNDCAALKNSKRSSKKRVRFNLDPIKIPFVPTVRDKANSPSLDDTDRFSVGKDLNEANNETNKNIFENPHTGDAENECFEDASDQTELIDSELRVGCARGAPSKEQTCKKIVSDEIPTDGGTSSMNYTSLTTEANANSSNQEMISDSSSYHDGTSNVSIEGTNINAKLNDVQKNIAIESKEKDETRTGNINLSLPQNHKNKEKSDPSVKELAGNIQDITVHNTSVGSENVTVSSKNINNVNRVSEIPFQKNGSRSEIPKEEIYSDASESESLKCTPKKPTNSETKRSSESENSEVNASLSKSIRKEKFIDNSPDVETNIISRPKNNSSDVTNDDSSRGSVGHEDGSKVPSRRGAIKSKLVFDRSVCKVNIQPKTGTRKPGTRRRREFKEASGTESEEDWEVERVSDGVETESDNESARAISTTLERGRRRKPLEGSAEAEKAFWVRRIGSVVLDFNICFPKKIHSYLWSTASN